MKKLDRSVARMKKKSLLRKSGKESLCSGRDLRDPLFLRQLEVEASINE